MAIDKRDTISTSENMWRSIQKSWLSRLTEGTRDALLALGVGIPLAIWPVQMAEAKTKPKTTITDFDINQIPSLDLSGLDIQGVEREAVFNALPNGENDIRALQAFLIQKWFLKIEKPTWNLWKLTLQALKQYQASVKITPTGTIDKKTYEKIATEMIASRVEAGIESFNNQPAAKFAFMYLLSRSLGIRLEGTYGKDIEQILATAGLKLDNGVLLKATVGYLTRGDDYTFSNGRTFHKNMSQFVAGLEWKYNNFPVNSFIQEVWAGVVMFDVHWKKLGKIGDIMSGGSDIGDIEWGVTGGRRYQWFVSTALRLAPNARLDLMWGYFTSQEVNPLDTSKIKTQWFMASGKLHIDLMNV